MLLVRNGPHTDVVRHLSVNYRGAAEVESAADEFHYLSGMTMSRSLVSTMKIARSLAGAVVLAF